MATPDPASRATYDQLANHFREIGYLEELGAISGWDEAVMMPRGAGAGRGAAMAALTTEVHRKVCDQRVGDWLDRLHGANESLSEWQAANVGEIARRRSAAMAMPEQLVTALSVAQTRCEQAWREARPKGDWATVAPLLEESVALVREQAACLASALDLAPYDALMDGYERGLRRAEIDAVFARLKAFLPDRVDAVIEAQARDPMGTVPGPVSVERQRALGLRLMRAVGFDFERGRLDVSHHPFCGGVPDDTRITTRYDEHDFLECMMAVLHESGHALYQQGLPVDFRQQPVGDALGMATHESQSLFMELQIARSPAFMRFAAPVIREELGASADDAAWSEDRLYRLATRVARGKIRVLADEVTYPLHVILRYELECALIDGDLSVADLPGAWIEKMRDYLRVDVSTDIANGCLQDVHWFAGLFGYFPTYTLGALMAAQWAGAARRALPQLDEQIARGEFEPVLGWLRANVHGRGRLLDQRALLTTVTGEPLNPAWFERHIDARYPNA